jgi:hypothetical protein
MAELLELAVCDIITHNESCIIMGGCAACFRTLSCILNAVLLTAAAALLKLAPGCALLQYQACAGMTPDHGNNA